MVDDIEDVFLCAFYGSVVLITGRDDLFADLNDLDDARRGADAIHISKKSVGRVGTREAVVGAMSRFLGEAVKG